MGIGRAGIGGLGIGGLGIGGLGIPSPSADPAFTMVVDTTKAGSASDTFIIPLDGSSSYNFDVDWGDGNSETHTANTDLTHVYSVSGIYTVKITGTLPAIRFANGGDRLKLLDITNWGDIEWSSGNNAYNGCSNLTGTYTDFPNLSGADNTGSMFLSCSSFIGDVSRFPMDTITASANMFNGCGLLDPDMSSWQIQANTVLAQICLNAGLTTSTYDKILNAWSLLSLQSNVNFGVGATTYTTATSQAARDILTNAPNSWNIADGGGV